MTQGETGATGRRVEYAVDEQTGTRYELVEETFGAKVAANFAFFYLLCVLAILLWMLFDTWSGRNYLLSHLDYSPAVFHTSSFRLMAYVAIGGAIGGTVDGIRSVISWHSERNAYGARFLPKDISLPLVGAAVALIVYATVREGAGVISGNVSLKAGGTTPSLAAFAVAALAGFSSQQVFRWLDAQANKLFQVNKAKPVSAPDLIGKTLDEAKAALKACKLKLGQTGAAESEAATVGKVVAQNPEAGANLRRGDRVDVTIGKAARSGDGRAGV